MKCDSTQGARQKFDILEHLFHNALPTTLLKKNTNLFMEHIKFYNLVYV